MYNKTFHSRGWYRQSYRIENQHSNISDKTLKTNFESNYIGEYIIAISPKYNILSV